MNGGGGVLAPLGGLDGGDLPGRVRDVVAHGERGRLVAQPRIRAVELELPAVEAREPGREGRRSRALERGVDRPVLDRDERLDLLLAVADDPQRHRLDAPGRKAPPDLLPEEVGDLVADEPVDDAPRLLRVDEAAVDLSGVFHRREHGLLGDLVEPDAAEHGLPGAGPERLLEMPRDRFALAVGVGGEVDVVGRLGRAPELVDRLLFARQDLVGRRVAVGPVDSEPLARQIPHVSVGGEDLEVLAEELLERLRFRGRLDDDEGFSHAGRGTVS